jgi:hypothetical protein
MVCPSSLQKILTSFGPALQMQVIFLCVVRFYSLCEMQQIAFSNIYKPTPYN